MAYDGPLIDVDVHHTWSSPADLLPYLPEEWREHARRLTGKTKDDGNLAMTWNPFRPALGIYPHPAGTNKRLDAYPPRGGPPGSDPEWMAHQLLDEYGVVAAILSFEVGLHASLTNPFFGVAAAEGGNRWSEEHWLDGSDDRFFGSMVVSTEFPELGVKEMRRAAQNPRMVELRLTAPSIGKPLGHPHYHPLYAAATELGLPAAIHVGGDSTYGTTQMAAGGIPGNRFEFQTLQTQGLYHHLLSFITYGVFERFPTFKLIIVEGGVAWAPALLTELDARYDVLREESHWVRRPPSEYFRQHVRMSTQPLESPDDRGDLTGLLESFGGMEDVLCFSTDYPHWDTDDPRYVGKRLPNSWANKLFHDNAACAYPRLGRDVRTANSG